jgi:hypothetical protein
LSAVVHRDSNTLADSVRKPPPPVGRRDRFLVLAGAKKVPSAFADQPERNEIGTGTERLKA